MRTRPRLLASSALVVTLALAGASSTGCAGDDGEGEVDAGRRDAAGLVDAYDPWAIDDSGADAGADTGTDAGTPPTDAGTPDAGLDCDDPKDFGGANSEQQLLGINDDGVRHQLSSDTKVGLVLNGKNDVDAYVVYANDQADFGIPNPFVEAESPTKNIELCVFLQCASGAFDNAPSCGAGSTGATNPVNGRPGCCATMPGKIHIDYDCKTADDDVNMSLRVKATIDACLPYEVSYLAGN